MSTRVDSVVLASIRDLARRKDAQICEVAELALVRLLQEDEASRTDALLAPLIDRVIESRLKTLEGGLRTLLARLGHETLTIHYILLNFLVEANIPAAKVEKWRTDGRKFAVHELRRRPRVDPEEPTEEDDEP